MNEIKDILCDDKNNFTLNEFTKKFLQSKIIIIFAITL